MEQNKDNPATQPEATQETTQQPEQPESPQQPEQTPDDIALAAMDKGIDEASEAPVAEAAEEGEEVEGSETANDATAQQAGKPEDAGEQPSAVETEIKELNLKEKAATRFRELTGRVEELSTALKTAGVEDIKQLPELVERAKYGEELVGRVLDTGADANQFGQALTYLQLVNAAGKGDVKSAETAFEIMQGELQALGKFLGREVPGIVDPLAEHPDLADEVESGDLPRARALEIAKTRNQGKIADSHAERMRESEGQTRQQQQAVDQARADLGAWDAEMQKADPTYMAKREALNGVVAEIRATKPPGDWVRLTALAYARIPNPAPAQQQTKPPPGPVRINRGSAGMVPEFKTAEDAMAFGIAAASQ